MGRIFFETEGEIVYQVVVPLFHYLQPYYLVEAEQALMSHVNHCMWDVAWAVSK